MKVGRLWLKVLRRVQEPPAGGRQRWPEAVATPSGGLGGASPHPPPPGKGQRMGGGAQLGVITGWCMGFSRMELCLLGTNGLSGEGQPQTAPCVTGRVASTLANVAHGTRSASEAGRQLPLGECLLCCQPASHSGNTCLCCFAGARKLPNVWGKTLPLVTWVKRSWEDWGMPGWSKGGTPGFAHGGGGLAVVPWLL